MDKPIKVLLVDDKKDYCESLLGPARHQNIQIQYELDWEKGFQFLKDNPSIEFVILDGKGKIEADQEVEKENFVVKAMKELDDFSNYSGRHIPYCVNTGYLDELNNFLDGNVKVFKKGDKDREDLFKYILDEVNLSNDRKIKKQHPEVFKIFSNNYLDNETEKVLIKLLQKLNDNNLNEHPKTEFTKLRKIIEKLVDKALQKNLIPIEVGTGNLTEAVGFLCDKSNDYNLTHEYFHPTINYLFPFLLAILQDGSHSKEELRYRVEEFALQQNNGYLFKVCIYQLFDVIIAFNHLFQNHKKNYLPEILWEKSKIENLFEGILQKDEGNNYFCGSYLLDYNKFHNIHQPGIKLRILKAIPNNAGRTKHLYPNFAPMFEIIE